MGYNRQPYASCKVISGPLRKTCRPKTHVSNACPGMGFGDDRFLLASLILVGSTSTSPKGIPERRLPPQQQKTHAQKYKQKTMDNPPPPSKFHKTRHISLYLFLLPPHSMPFLAPGSQADPEPEPREARARGGGLAHCGAQVRATARGEGPPKMAGKELQNSH